MALKINTVYKNIPVTNAYVVVGIPSVSADKTRIEFGAWYKADAESEVFQSDSYAAPFELEGDNIFEQAYAYLKTLPEFTGSIDC